MKEKNTVSEYEININNLEKWRQFLGDRKKVKDIKKIDKTLNIVAQDAFLPLGIIIGTGISMLLFAVLSLISGSMPFFILCIFWEIVFCFIAYRVHKKSIKCYKISKEGKFTIEDETFYSGYEMLYVGIIRKDELIGNTNKRKTMYYINIQSNNNYHKITPSTISVKKIFELLDCFIYED